jgi:hypothetical protein
MMVVAWIVVLRIPNAQAVLGEKIDSIASDRRALSVNPDAVTISIPKNRYEIHQLKTDAVIVKEFASKSGVVFGLSWSGNVQPDLSQLLGSYRSEYFQALSESQSHPRSLRPRSSRRVIRGPHLIVEHYGHMRAIRGRAYVPDLLPEGVKPDELK